MSERRDARRIRLDDEVDRRLETADGRAEYWAELAEEGRQSALVQLLESTLALDGDVIECGVFRGGSLRMICRAVAEAPQPKAVFACDSFAGFPPENFGKVDLGRFRRAARVGRKFRSAGDVPARLQRFFAAYGLDGHVLAGFFADTLGAVAGRRFSFIHLDCDLYQSHLDCLRLWDSLVPGGVVVFDDYAEPKWPGATKAIDEFFETRMEKPQLATGRPWPAWYVRKFG